MRSTICNAEPAAIGATAVRRALVRWYARHRRDLPWRRQPANPYHVLVSEAMLQQTQVATVLGYFDRFIAAFPTIEVLAGTDEQRVLRLWQGLGYYRRARYLHAAAKVIVREHHGQIPDTVEALLKLPGVGRYSAGAIASIAYDRPAPILDGNVARVLARLYGIDQPIDDHAVRERLWRLSATLVPNRRGGDFNQALMELGALVCTPRQPRCRTCPLRDRCATRSDVLPIKASRARPKAVAHTIVAVSRNGRFLFERRGDTGLWAGMWQLPTVERSVEPVAWIAARFHLAVAAPRRVHHFTHQTTHRTICFRVLAAETLRGRLRPRAGQWRRLSDLDDLPLANPQRRAVEHLLQHAPACD